tara:strand:+ start:190840 stop:192072 length:1233 start_codon:yes stop_codon:yes gene_type:complete
VRAQRFHIYRIAAPVFYKLQRNSARPYQIFWIVVVPLLSAHYFAIVVSVSSMGAAFAAADTAADPVDSAESLTDKRVVSRVREALARFDSVHLSAVATVSDGSRGQRERIEIKKGGVRTKLSKKIIFTGGEAVDRSVSGVWQDIISYRDGDVMFFQTDTDGLSNQIDRNLGLLLFSDRIAGSQKFDSETLIHSLNDAAIVVWNLGDFPIVKYLDSADLVSVSRMGRISEVVAEGILGKLMLRVDSSHGWLPESFELLKLPFHRTANGTVSSVFGDSVPKVEWTGAISSFSGSSESGYFPSELNVTRLIASADERLETEISIEQVVFDPELSESDFQTKIRIPVGEQVRVDEADHLPYIWDGERAVPGVVNRAANPSQFRRGNGHFSRLAVMGCTTFVLALLLFYARRYAA